MRIKNKKILTIFCLTLLIIILPATMSAIEKEVKTYSTDIISISNKESLQSESIIKKQRETIQEIIPKNKFDIRNIPLIFELKVGEEFYLDVDGKNEEYRFSDNSDLFDINKENGEIKFTPTEVGEFNIVVIALKDIKDFEYKLIKFRVIG